jgi:hypothetical protein
VVLLSRREFCGFAGGSLALAAAPIFLRGFAEAHQIDIAAIDHSRVLKAASAYLKQKPITITAASSPRSAGDSHDYFSEGDYWWPDPNNPNGSYIRRDGMSNPGNFIAHREALIRFSVQMPALAAAWWLTRDRKYSDHAAAHLRAWFIDPATKMNPNLQYAQAIHGITTGRGTGIIDTIHLVEVARATSVLADGGVLEKEVLEKVQAWFADYLKWMTGSGVRPPHWQS